VTTYAPGIREFDRLVTQTAVVMHIKASPLNCIRQGDVLICAARFSIRRIPQ
jgi:hypothetical protein